MGKTASKKCRLHTRGRRASQPELQCGEEAEEPLEAGSRWFREGQCSSWVWSLVGSAAVNGPHIHFGVSELEND